MIIIKTITRKYVITAIAINMFTYDESFRKIRSKFRYQGNTCYNCGHKFNDNEKISLVQFKNYPNRLVCRHCARHIDETLKQEERDVDKQ